MRSKMTIIIGLLLISSVAAYMIAPISQWDSYHQFSDSRKLFFINNFTNVASNLGFIVFGFYGVFGIFQNNLFDKKLDLIPYFIFFFSIIFVGLGSSYYHWKPSTETLFWDRLPMSVSFMSLFAAIICDRINRIAGIFVVMPIILLTGVYSVIYWQYTEMMAVGDLRLYGLVQFFPILAIPIILFLFRNYKYTVPNSIFWILGWYVCAKLFEHYDSSISNLFGGYLSGHSIKHLAASVSVILVLRMLKKSKMNRC